MSNKPDFIFVGPGRSGTTFLYHYLSKHPDVYLAKDVKEINFFNEMYDEKDADWYQSFFSECPKGHISGEISNMYFYDISVPKKIKEIRPNTKIITILRNPYERIVSAYQYRLSVGEIFNVSLDEALIQYPDLIEQNKYHTLLSEYYRNFDSSQISVLFYDDLKNNSRSFLNQVNDILGIKEIAFSFDENTKNSRNAPRFTLLTKLVRLVSDVLRKYQLYKIHGLFKNSALVRKFVFSKAKKKIELSESSKKLLRENLQSEIDDLAVFLKRDLSNWKL